eukprot:15367144-Ditylum_brightwellii.AAC.1
MMVPLMTGVMAVEIGPIYGFMMDGGDTYEGDIEESKWCRLLSLQRFNRKEKRDNQEVSETVLELVA